MKLAFSTLGVPGLPLADVLRLATEHGYHGVELRAHPEEPVHPGLTPAERADAAAAFEAAGVEVLVAGATSGATALVVGGLLCLLAVFHVGASTPELRDGAPAPEEH
ncbi:hypothetical protein SGRIM128S_04888 [Streptomyces griseomycini]